MAAVRSNSAPASRSQSASPPHPSTKSKRQRTKHACDECRRAQKKCDGVQPRCRRCFLNDTTCTYTPHKGRGRPVEYHARHHNAQNASPAAAVAAADVVPFEEVFMFNTQSPNESTFTMNTTTTQQPVMSTMLAHSFSTSTAASSSGPMTPISPGGSSSSSSPQHDFPHTALPFDDYHSHHPYHFSSHVHPHAQLSYPPQHHQPQLPQLYLPTSSSPSIPHGLSSSDFSSSPREGSSPLLSPGYYSFDDDTTMSGFRHRHHHQSYNTAPSSSSSPASGLSANLTVAPSQAPITSSSAGGQHSIGSGAGTAGLNLSSGTTRNRSASSVRKRSPLALDTNVTVTGTGMGATTASSSSEDTATTTAARTTNLLQFPTTTTNSGGLSSPVAGSPYEAASVTNEMVFRPHPYAIPSPTVQPPPQMQHRQLSLPNDLSPRPPSYPLAQMAIGGGPSHPSLHHHHALMSNSNYPSHHYHPYMHAQRQQQATWGAGTRQMTISSPSPLLYPTGGGAMSSPAAVSTSLSPSSPPASLGGGVGGGGSASGSGGSGSGGSRDDNHSSSGSGCGGSACGSSPGMMMMHEHEQGVIVEGQGSTETGNASGHTTTGTAHVIQDFGVLSSDHVPSSSYPHHRLHVQQQQDIASSTVPDSPTSSSSNDHSNSSSSSHHSHSNHSRTPTVTYSSRTPATATTAVTLAATTSSPQTPSSETAPDGSLLFSMRQQADQTQVQEDNSSSAPPSREVSTTPSATGVYYQQTSPYNDYHHHAHQQQHSEYSSLYYTSSYDQQQIHLQHDQQFQPDTQSHVNTRSYDSIPHTLSSATSSPSDLHHPRGGVIASPGFEYEYGGGAQNQNQSHQYPYDYHHQQVHHQSHEIGG